MCTSLTILGDVVDNGALPCQQPQVQVGVVVTSDTTATSHLITLQRGQSIPVSPGNVAVSSAASIGAQTLCGIPNQCPAGLYRFTANFTWPTKCSTTGTYSLNLSYTDDVGLQNPQEINISNLSSPGNNVYTTFILRSTGATAIQYSTTATACGTGGPALGNLYMTIERLMWQ
jgi:hypothetical protein